MKRLLCRLVAISLSLAVVASNAQPLTPFTAPAITNTPSGDVLMRAERAAPWPETTLVEQTREAEAVRANLLAASSNAVGLVQSAQRINSVPGGGRADFGLLKVFFPADAAGEDRFRITPPAGRTLVFQPRFLAWHDTSTGERWLLAQVTNRVGLIFPSGQVLYTNAFGPDALGQPVRADLRFRYGCNLLEQDVILRERPALPESAAAENLRLEVWTEWFDSVPEKRQAQAVDLRRGQDAPALATDEQADFLSARIGGGSAFTTSEPDDKFPVAKTWARVDERDWLVETVDYQVLKTRFDALGGAGGKRTAKVSASQEELIRSLAASPGAPATLPASSLIDTAQRAGQEASAPSLLLALADLPETPGVVVDFAIQACVPVPPGIISWWPAGANAEDAIVASGNDGTLYETAGFGPGKVGQSFIFDGIYSGDYVQIANAPSLNPQNGLTIEAWVYFTADTVGWNMPIVSKDGGNGRQYLLTKTDADVIRAHVGIAGDTFRYTDGEIVLQPETWHHVAMTYSVAESALKIYVDGELDMAASVSGTLLTTTEPLYIGGAPNWWYFWAGGIDEVSVYGRALSAAELELIYEAGPAGKINPNCAPSPTDLVAWFPADTHPYDVSGGRIATLQNGAGYAPAVASHGFLFDGVNDAVTAPHDGALDFGAGEDFSLEVWLKADQITNPYGVMSVLGKRYSPNSLTALGYELFLLDGKPGVQLADASGPGSFIASTVLWNTGWRHVVVTVDRDSTTGGRIYVDGAQVYQFNPTSKNGNLSNNDPLRIGVHPQAGLNCFYKGVIDEATVYRRALSGTEVSGLYQAGSAGKCKADLDGDGLEDWWEMRYFGSLDHGPDKDADGDGLTNLEEQVLGYDPTITHTGGSDTSDADKDYDGDLLSNIAELRYYGSDPANAHTFSPWKTDAEYLMTARPGDPDSAVSLSGPYFPGGNQIRFVISGAAPDAPYDLYIRPDLNPGTKWKRYYSGSAGQTEITCPMPPGFMNYFIVGLASDADGDGLTDGYEALVSKTGLNTKVTDPDNLPDGWEVQYGLNPLSATGGDGDTGDPDADSIPNLTEFNSQTDPKRHNINQQARRVVSVTATDPTASEAGDTAKFLITRTGSIFTSLTVYYVLGGSATVGSDYTLNPSPSEAYPGYSITIPAGSASRELQVVPTADAIAEGSETVIFGLMPDPTDQYVVAMHPHRAMATIRDRVCHAYDVNADFLTGLFVGTVAETHQVHLAATTPAQFPYLNVACSGRGTVARVHVETGAIVGEYQTAPDGMGANPSRTTVDQFGNVWVANRDEAGSVNSVQMGSITRIGLIEGTRYLAPGDPTPNENGMYVKLATATYNTCLDRDGDGYIKTSRGLGNFLPWPNTLTGADTLGGVSTAEDEAITAYVRVRDIGTRTIAVDKFNDLWVGGTDSENTIHQKVDGLLAQVVPDTTFFPGCGGYGGVIDMNGVLWSARGGSGLLRFEPPATFPVASFDDFFECLGLGGGDYGLAVDPVTGKVWHTSFSHPPNGRITRWEPDGMSNTPFDNHGWECAQGVVVDANGNVWVAHGYSGMPCGSASHVGHLRTDGTFVGNVDLSFGSPPVIGVGPTGLAVDRNGKIWVVCRDSNNAFRIDPAAGPTINGHKLGAVDMPAVDLGAEALPYNYSDMTGFNNRIVNPGGCPLKGSWTVIEDGVWPNALWDTVSWTANTPAGTGVEVFIRVSDNRANLSTRPFVSVQNGVPLTEVRGRFLEVSVVLSRDACEKDPYLENLTICRFSPTLTVTPLADQDVLEGDEVQFQVIAVGTEPLTYGWFFNGASIPNESGPVLSLTSADCLDNGQYSVRVSDASGETVEAGPANLTVFARPINIPSVGRAFVYPAEITVAGAPLSVSSVEVTLFGFSHTRPDDMDILLVSPGGKKIMLISDAGGTIPVQNLTLTFAASGIPPLDNGPLDGNQILSSSNFGEPETTLPPAAAGNPNPPAGPYTDSLRDLDGSNPNGVWQLYVVDDAATGAGSISGSWCLTLRP